MFVRQCFGDARAVVAGTHQIAAGILRKQHIHQIHLGNSCGDGAGLQGIFIGAALQHNIRILRAGGMGETGDQNHLALAFFRQLPKRNSERLRAI